jgi:hypothetical protein
MRLAAAAVADKGGRAGVRFMRARPRAPSGLVRVQVTPADAALVAAAATAANLFESVLGAAVQGRVAWLSNDVVNALQISVAAALAICGHLLAFADA